jgi:peptidoglycan/xylan/chitin deacetylase (PgdA/CDA1 family)
MRQSVAPQAERAVKGFLGVVDRFAPPLRGVTMLTYHQVGGRSSRSLDLPTGPFTQQMEALAASGRAATLEMALGSLEASVPPDPDPLVVTFDDGTEDFADVAVPILDRYRIPVILYVSTDFIERGVPFDYEGGTPLSWTAIEESISTGLVRIGSHTHTHPRFDRISPELAVEEIDRSHGLIEDRLGISPKDFAYPQGRLASREIEGVIRSRFRSAALVGDLTNRYHQTDPYRLGRWLVRSDETIERFRQRLTGKLALEESMRRGLRRRRGSQPSP